MEVRLSLFEGRDVVRREDRIIQMLLDEFTGRVQDVEVATGARIGQVPVHSNIDRRRMEQAKPAAGHDTMCGQQARVVVADGLVHEDPAMLAIRLLDKPVEAERWDGSTWKDDLVDGALDQRGLSSALLGDDGGATRNSDPVDLVLTPAYFQRSNQERLDVRPSRLLLQRARTERKDCRGCVRGAERRRRERDGRQQPPRGGSEGDRPRHPERLGGARGHEHRALRRPRCRRRASEPRDEPHDRRASGLEPDAPGERGDLEPAAALAADAHAEPPRRDVVQDKTPGHVPAVALSPAERERVGLDRELGGRGGADVDEARALSGHARLGQRLGDQLVGSGGGERGVLPGEQHLDERLVVEFYSR